MQILVAQQEQMSVDHVTRILSEHNVIGTTDGGTALLLGSDRPFDVIILDRLLTTVDGLSVARNLRTSGSTTPLMFLTVVNGLNDRVEGLKAGADDYLGKPFEPIELLARVIALGRRRRLDAAIMTEMRVADLRLDVLRREVRRGGHRLELFPMELTLLQYLMKHEGQIATKTMLLERVWGITFTTTSTIVETHVSRLRAKVDRPFQQQLIHTVRGAGYSLHI